jgi:hypothetical protein
VTFLSTTTDFQSTASAAFATIRREERASVGEGDLLIVMLFVAIGLLLTAIFFTGSLEEFGQILAAGRLIVEMKGQGPVIIGLVVGMLVAPRVPLPATGS